MKFREIPHPSGYRIVQGFDHTFNAYVVIDNINKGPALGGTRYREYESDAEQLEENIGLAQSMTYKNALADIPYGGGKATIASTWDPDRWKKYADLLNFVNKDGHFYTAAGDMGTGTKELQEISKHSEFVAVGNVNEDSGYATAYGVYMAILGATKYVGIDKTDVALGIEGYGKVGARLANMANKSEFDKVFIQDPYTKIGLTGLDFNHQSRDTMLRKINVFSPCALGGSVDSEVLNTLTHKDVIVPGANNPEQCPDMLDFLFEKGIHMVPAFVANNGGVKMIARGIRNPLGSYQDSKMIDALKDNISLTKSIFQESDLMGKNPTEIALELAKDIVG